ncbi:MAG: response regulator transcription factor [Lachnospiraceae bacterium]|nr:response regulator transcription factor [Lachnospiraceae bacterium]
MKIVVIDDDRLVALSLKTILENTGKIEIAAIGTSGEEGIALYEEHHPDVLLMDIRMQGMSGLEAGEKILAKDKDAKILYLTTFSDDEYIVKAFRLGAKGYILKQDFNGIEPALAAVMNGQRVFGDTVMDRLPELMSEKKEPDYSKYGLTDKEWDIIKLIAKGLSNKEIAAEMYLGEGTVRNYLSQILEKLSLRDRTQVAVFYYNL